MVYTFKNGFSVSTDNCTLIAKDRFCPVNCKTVEESLYRSSKGLHFIVRQSSFVTNRGACYSNEPIMFPISKEKTSVWMKNYQQHQKDLQESLEKVEQFKKRCSA